MKARPVVPRERAARDVEEAVDYLLAEAGTQVALAFIDALERAYAHIGANPASGSARYAHELGLPDARFWRVEGYRYLIFYAEQPDHIDVWRVLHAQRDLPAWMTDLP